MHAQLQDNDGAISDELIAAQGAAVDVGGYFAPDGDVPAWLCGRRQPLTKLSPIEFYLRSSLTSAGAVRIILL